MAQANYPTSSPEGCFSSSGALTFSQSITFDSSAACKNNCLKANAAVAAMTAKFDCWCGNEYPPESDKVELSQCNIPCPAYPYEFCGAPTLWTVWSTGKNPTVDFSSGGGSSSSSSTSSTASSTSKSTSTSTSTSSSSDSSTEPPTPATVTLGGQTIVQTLGSTANPTVTPVSHSDTGATVGAAVGGVVGALALIALIAGVFFYLRRQNADGHHRRNSSMNGFVNADRHPPAYAAQDSRLDPSLMTERRQSAGSVFADNQDYSRRILKVTNPDGS